MSAKNTTQIPESPVSWLTATRAAQEWFRDARFGLFIHWGLYALPAGVWKGKKVDYIGEWLQHEEKIPVAEYERLAKDFNPKTFDARRWVELALQSGMRYLVFTTKHHEGFAMYHSRADRFNIVDATPFGRDPLAELADACRGTDLKLGIYYSHCVDWHEPHGGNLPSDIKPNYANDPNYTGRSWGNDWDFPVGTDAGFAEYLERKAKAQLTELLTGYGPIALIWFDTPMPSMTREQALDIRDLVKRHQPGCLVGGRIGHGLHDFLCLGDNQLPETPLNAPAEACVTLNETWGYKEHDQDWKSPAQVAGLLADCAAHGCNLLLNVGPMADGRFPAAAVDCLSALGDWMAANGEAIHGTGSAALPVHPPSGRLMARGSTLYHAVTDATSREASLLGLRSKIRGVRLLGHGDATVTPLRDGDGNPDGARVGLPPAVNGLPRVVALELDGEPRFDPRLREQPGGVSQLPAHAARGGDVLARPAQPGATATWTVHLDRPGRFSIVVITGGDTYGRWSGGHRVAFQARDVRLTATTTPDEPVPGLHTRHYPQFGTRLGTIELPAGPSDLTLSVIALATGTDASCKIAGISLAREGDGSCFAATM
jgi:alpha-L-fucosidase